jgi:hypothetical protein
MVLTPLLFLSMLWLNYPCMYGYRFCVAISSIRLACMGPLCHVANLPYPIVFEEHMNLNPLAGAPMASAYPAFTLSLGLFLFIFNLPSQL